MPPSSAPTHFVFLLMEDYTHLAFSCAIEPLRIANLVSGEELYRWTLISPDGRTARCSHGSTVSVQAGLEPLHRDDFLMVISGLNVQDHISPDILKFLRRCRAHGTQIGALCSGAYVLAQTGFLDGEDAAIHWAYHELFAEKFPAIKLKKSVFVADARHVTASGGAAAADLMLHLISRDHGRDLAIEVADQMVYNAVREGDAEQRLSLQSRHNLRNGHLIRAIRLIEASIETPLSPTEVAAHLGISTRQLERLFMRYMKTTPKRFIMEMRLQRARILIQQTDDSISEIAMACGFNSTSHFSKVYRAQYGSTPIGDRRVLH